MALALFCRGVVALLPGDLVLAEAVLEEALAIFRELGDQWGIGLTLQRLGNVAQYRGDLGVAQARLEEAMNIFHELGDRFLYAYALLGLAYVAQYHDAHWAMALYRESLVRLRELGDREGLPRCLEGLAMVACRQGNFERAVHLFGAAEVLREAIHVPVTTAEHPDFDHSVAAARANLDEATFAAAWAEGRAMSLEQAATYATAAGSRQLEKDRPVPQAGKELAARPNASCKNPAGLTAREVEVLRLVAQGLSDRVVAEMLGVSPRTINAHLTSIYSKFAVSSRAAATRFAIEHGLA